MKQDNEPYASEVMKTMEIFEQMPRLRVHHLFRARLMQKIGESGKNVPVKSSAAGMFSPRLVLVTLLVMANIVSAILLFSHDAAEQAAGTLADTQESFNEEYAGPALSYYASND